MTNVETASDTRVSERWEPAWGLISYRIGAQPPRAGVVTSGAVIRALPAELGSRPLLDLVGDWPPTRSLFLSLDPVRLAPVEEAELDVPLRFPPKMVFAGANYFTLPADLVSEPDGLGIRLRVNGTLQQDAVTSDMVSDVRAILVAITEILTLEPGDILVTGTPAGVGVARDTLLRLGDRVTAEVQGIGRVSNTIALAGEPEEHMNLMESHHGR